jgi:hypothetical protein
MSFVRLLAIALAIVACGSARAQETPMTCTGEPEADAPVAVAPAPAAPPTMRPGDVALAIAVLAGGAGAVAYVRANERRRRARRLAATPVDAVPYVAGAGLGLLAAVSLLAFHHPLGIAGGIASIAAGTWTWGAAIVPGVFAGALISAVAAGRWRLRTIPEAGWRERFGPRPALRWAVAFAGGVLIQYGAELAGGCTSGLAVSGGVVLAPGAFVFMAAMFAAGIPTARAMAGRGA